VVPVLDNMNLTIESGSCVAIIGNSGMGKSTLIKVMQHAYQAQSGTVEIDNCDLDTVSEASLRNCLTYINQTPIFWQQKTIKENLLMFNPKATEKDLKKALDLANLSVELSKKKKGINSKVSSLSAGQKQRLSLARAFLRKTPIVIMDEPTANLDTVAQNKVLEAIKSFQTNYHPKITLVFASNVPAEIAMADRILLMENGKIVEDGSTFDLMNDTTSKTYQRLKKYKALFEKEVNDSLSLRSETK
jgi:ABC-type bacteriocin/lantibiotic exporter with double-glycine peptidase domain